jgi:hypothetical protein
VALSRRSSQTSAHSCSTDDPAGTGGSSDTNHHDQHTHTVIKPTRREIHTTAADPHSRARQVVNSYEQWTVLTGGDSLKRETHPLGSVEQSLRRCDVRAIRTGHGCA